MVIGTLYNYKLQSAQTMNILDTCYIYIQQLMIDRVREQIYTVFRIVLS